MVAGVAVVDAGVTVVGAVVGAGVAAVVAGVVLLPEELDVPGSFRLMGGDLLSSRRLAVVCCCCGTPGKTNVGGAGGIGS